MATASIIRLAPTEKLAPWLAMTRPTPSCSARPIALWVMARMSPVMAFIFEWNSKPKTPSPRSRTEQLAVFSTTLPAFLRISRRIWPGFTGTGR